MRSRQVSSSARLATSSSQSCRFSSLGASLDRLVIEEPLQVGGQLTGRRVPPRWVLLQALQADGLDVARHLGVQPRGGHRILGNQQQHHLGSSLRAKRRLARQQLVQHRPQRVNVQGWPNRRVLPWACSGAM